MTENVVHISNTPIFDQMVAELAERGRRFENLLSGGSRSSVMSVPEKEEIVKPVEEVAVTTLSGEPYKGPQCAEKSAPTMTSLTAMETAREMNLDEIMTTASKDFALAHPNAVVTEMRLKEDGDGSITIAMSGREPVLPPTEFFRGVEKARGGVKLAKRPELYLVDNTPGEIGEAERRRLERMENLKLAATTPIPGGWLEKMPPELVDHIGEDTADSLSVMPAFWAVDEE